MTAGGRTTEEVAERYRQEKYHLLFNNCLIKSVRFARECGRLGIDVRVVFCLGAVPARLPGLGKASNIPVLHAWGEVDGERIELSHPLGHVGILGMMPGEVKPLLRVRF
jgi:hypothetical protein